MRAAVARSLATVPRSLAAAGLTALGLAALTAWGAESGSQAPLAAGSAVPPMTLRAVKPGSATAGPLELGSLLGRKPIVICYLLPGESLGEGGCIDLQSFVQEKVEGRIELLFATRLTPRVTLAATLERAGLLGLDAPLIVEEDPVLGRALGVTMAPSISLIDASGRLRIADARSLKQTVASGFTLAQAILNAARGGPVPAVGKLPRYYPASDLVGTPFPDFMLRKFEANARIKLSDVVAPRGGGQRLTALMFWHPDCKHCKTAMPGLMAGYDAYRKWLEIVSVVDLRNENEVRNCQDAIRGLGVTFPVLVDEGRRVSDLYKVISTPTVFLIGPDGVVDSVYTSGGINFVTVFDRKIVSLLKVEPPASKAAGKTAGGPDG